MLNANGSGGRGCLLIDHPDCYKMACVYNDSAPICGVKTQGKHPKSEDKMILPSLCMLLSPPIFSENRHERASHLN